MYLSFLLIFRFFILSQTLSSQVVGVMDGDTIELREVSNSPKAKERIGKNIRVRFAHIDCPERGKPYFQVAKKFVSDRCYRKTVKIIHSNEFDRYGRLIGEVILEDGTNLNQELVKAGLAIHYKKYSKSYTYAKLEIEAKNKKIGIWAQ
ncbi:nuclease [Lacihabitans sp. LS3-19]|uniref:thermonuclease family protein n=1 Tax=Lacihabitans sp. LS3-19 TaxID=2487335 RepID=UPI0020CB75AF|nr:thermonuclease family protein [Lacihabitans sp. LS3-19]MCP9767950.1 nuclease [Lacihabitans sp. LS3-19]